MDLNKFAYCVYDTETELFWISSSGKSMWASQPAAKNAWNVKQPWQDPKFNQQRRFIVVKAKLVIVED